MTQLYGRLGGFRFLLLAGAFSIFVYSASAQFTSAVEGTVMDASKAAVPGAKVTAANQATGIAYRATSNNLGVFRVTTLPLGTYRVEIEAPGFKPWVQTGMELAGSQVRTLNVALELGAQASTIEVVATAIAAVETGKSVTGTEISPITIEQAPLLSRNIFTGLVAMVPGLTGTGTSSADNYTPEAGYGISAGGQPNYYNAFQVDGASVQNSSRGGQTYFNPAPDLVEAVKVSSADFSAEKGRFSGASIEVYTKSGTNAFHGNVSLYHTNNRLQARTISQIALPAARRNEFGGTFGGPIVKSKTFFFGSFFGLSSSTVRSSTNTVETPQFRQFIVNQYPNSMAAAFFKVSAPMVEPTAQFLTIDQLMRTLPGSFPVPASWPRDMQVVGTNYVDLSVPRTGRQLSVRADHNFGNQKDRLSYSLMRQRGQNFSTSFRKEFPVKAFPDINWMNRLSWIHTFSANLLNESSVAYIRTSGGGGAVIGHYELPQASITGLSFVSNSGWSFWIHNDFTWHEVLAWTRGRHSMRFGIDIDRQRDDDDFSNQQLHSSFRFTNILDFAQDRPFSQTGPIVDARTGGPAQGLFQRIRLLYIAPFVQDDVKVTRNLTVNFGLRYDYFGHLNATKNDTVGIPQFQYGPGGTDAERVANGSMKTLGDNRGFVIPNKVDGWGPRIGVGWDVFGNGKLAIRGGWGVYFNKQANFIGLARLNPPNWAQPQVTIQDANPVFSYKMGPNYDPPPSDVIKTDSKGGIVGKRVAVSGTAPNFAIPRTQSWMFSIQRTMASWLLEADYNGSHSDRQMLTGDVNRFAGDLILNKGVLTRLNSSFGSISVFRTLALADSHLVTLMASKRFSRSWSLKSIFNVGRSINWADITNDGMSSTLEDWMHPDVRKGRASYDVKKRLTLESVLAVPSPWRTGLGYRVLGGWRLANIVILQDGAPFSVTTSQAYPNGDFNADGNTSDNPNAPAFGSKIPHSRRDFQNGVFKRADFPLPPLGMLGNLGRNVFTGPGFANVNTSIAKTFKLTGLGENTKLEFIGELFNALNRVNLGGVSSNMTSTTFGMATTSSDARRVQFGVRIAF
jgi:hypothetical protein